ncbi:hypothetical protein BH10PSE17_BH10PSE17_04620 [soil metagenome]
MSIAAATGVSEGAAGLIADLLIDDLTALPLLELRHLKFRTNQYSAGVLCHRLCGVHPRPGDRFSIFVSIEDRLVRKIIHHGSGREQVRWDIKVDEPIDDSIFAPEASP